MQSKNTDGVGGHHPMNEPDIEPNETQMGSGQDLPNGEQPIEIAPLKPSRTAKKADHQKKPSEKKLDMTFNEGRDLFSSVLSSKPDQESFLESVEEPNTATRKPVNLAGKKFESSVESNVSSLDLSPDSELKDDRGKYKKKSVKPRDFVDSDQMPSKKKPHWKPPMQNGALKWSVDPSFKDSYGTQQARYFEEMMDNKLLHGFPAHLKAKKEEALPLTLYSSPKKPFEEFLIDLSGEDIRFIKTKPDGNRSQPEGKSKSKKFKTEMHKPATSMRPGDKLAEAIGFVTSVSAPAKPSKLAPNLNNLINPLAFLNPEGGYKEGKTGNPEEDEPVKRNRKNSKKIADNKLQPDEQRRNDEIIPVAMEIVSDEKLPIQRQVLQNVRPVTAATHDQVCTDMDFKETLRSRITGVNFARIYVRNLKTMLPLDRLLLYFPYFVFFFLFLALVFVGWKHPVFSMDCFCISSAFMVVTHLYSLTHPFYANSSDNQLFLVALAITFGILLCNLTYFFKAWKIMVFSVSLSLTLQFILAMGLRVFKVEFSAGQIILQNAILWALFLIPCRLFYDTVFFYGLFFLSSSNCCISFSYLVSAFSGRLSRRKPLTTFLMGVVTTAIFFLLLWVGFKHHSSRFNERQKKERVFFDSDDTDEFIPYGEDSTSPVAN
jgi:hypothetical protein